MPQNNVSGLHAALLDVSNPSSPNYGKHLSKDEVTRLVAPKPESVQAVTDWFNKNGITATNGTLAGDEMTIQVPVDQANSLLAANFTTFIHAETNTHMVRTLAYSLPANLADHISFVYPTTHFAPPASKSGSMTISRSTPPLSQENVARDVPADCANTITPACLFALYNIPPDPASAPDNNLFVAGFRSDIAADDDLQAFLSQTRPDNPALASTTYQLVSVDGVENFPQGTDEGNADIQYTRGVATNVPVTYVSFGGGGQLSDNLAMINFLIQQETAPLVLTTSYVFAETFTGSDVDLAIQLCNAYAQLGARGTSVLFSSGDSGVAGGGFRNPQCLPGNVFLPTFPAGCPFVTAVGGTTGINPEVAISLSSGGFSNIFPRPSYQETAVGNFLTALGNNNTGLFNASGRAYPDVALQAQFYFVLTNGVPLDGGFEGTSASSPVFASMVSLVNDRLLNAGKPPLGFLNPLLYSDRATAMFNDITAGSNPGCNTNGFSAVQGWDAVTGFGSVDFQRFLTVALANDTRFDPTQQPSAGSTASSVGSTAAPGSTQGPTQTQGSGASTPGATGSGSTSAPSQSPGQAGGNGNSAMRGAGVGVGSVITSFLTLLLTLVLAVA
ncbi:family S53 protease-like protein [Lentinus tigrinus ALCF2SS1-7]|uniref:Family S53 protease-like protein n=1 Tax=Lentinus tigrinus ALCF2SS1-6 TaxID=1328759 RepID=A0A5C2SLT6_9APHY|nr:family S53 protease-like protein [Lentinus tigrinus ALCF2SS1-6]RPD76298.1 family S53 protease-like protein [Lentinus tigrinus ALCF2SS1-7]